MIDSKAVKPLEPAQGLSDTAAALPGGAIGGTAPAPRGGASSPGRRAQLRAAAITLVLLVECTAALPRHPLNQQRLARPEGQRLIGWIERGLNALGQPTDRKVIARALVRSTRAAVGARGALLAPFGAFFHYTSTHQQWGLFITPKRQSHRIHVDARRGTGAWIALYRAPGAADMHGLGSALRYRRVRAIYHPRINTGVHAEYPGFVAWLAAELLAAHPDYDAVRVRMERIAIGAPGEPLQHLGFEHELIHTRRRGPGA
jgi:hypothetical protein